MDFSGVCVKCGKCKAVCPTYTFLKREDCSPRGRVHLADKSLKSEESFLTCLMCMACEEVCPQKVSITEKIVESKKRLRLLSYSLISAGIGLTSSLGAKFKGKPSSSSKKVAVFVGCLLAHRYPDLVDRLCSFLSFLAFDVVVPEYQVCCGFPMYVGGIGWEGYFKRNLKAFSGFDAVVTACSTCASFLKKKYPFRKVVDVAELIVEYAFVLELGEKEKVAFHPPCHLVRGQSIDAGELVSKLGLIPLSETCCGFGGVLSLKYPNLSLNVGRKRIEEALAKEANVIATLCPACMFQFEKVSMLSGARIKVMHLLDLISFP